MTNAPDPRQAFLRYREHGDPAALAEVFDLVAQRLLLVASHVANRQQQPEDLLQETFLTAIRKADRYDGTRPLEPWLIGILVNVVRNDRRRRRRERTGVELDEEHVAGEQPSDEAAHAEFVEALRRAIDGLPLPQREVMTLSLVHGMTPTEIAHATARPVGTVKSWIHRSRDAVRRRLPTSLAVTFGALVRGMQRLDHVRAEVLAAGAAAAAGVAAGGVAAGGAATGGAAVARRVALAVLLLAVPLVAYLATRSPAPAATGGDVAAASAPTSAPDSAPAASPGASRVDASSVEAAPTAAPNVCTLRILGEFDGAPFAWRGYVVSVGAPDAMLQRVDFVTGADGSYTFRGVPFGYYALQPDRGPQLPVMIERAEQTVRVPMRGGVDVVGRVVDDRGHGVAGARVWQTIEGRLDLRLEVASSDERGGFRVPCATIGHYLSATCDGARPSRLRQVPAEPGAPLVLTIDEVADHLDLEVVDEVGEPVQNATVQVGDMLGPAPRRENDKTRSLRQAWVGRTDAQGYVACGEVPRDRDVRLYVRAAGRAATMRVLAPEEGRRRVRVTLPRGATCHGALRRPDGSPLSGVARATSATVTPGAHVPGWFWPTCITGDRGAFTLVGVPAGEVLLQARTDSGETKQERRKVANGETVEWLVVLGDAGRIAGRALDADGAPLVGVSVRAVAAGRPPAFAEVAADGAFEVAGLPDRRFELCLQRGAHADALLLHRFRDVGLGDDVVLQLPRERTPTARVRGRLVRADLDSVGLFDARTGGYCLAQLDADGAFAFGAVPAGDYVLLAGRTATRLRRDVRLDVGALVDLGPVDLAATTPVTVRCTGVTGDAPLTLFVFHELLGPLLAFARPAPDDDHELSLPPGRCRVMVQQGVVAVADRVVDVGSEPLRVELACREGVDVSLSASPASPRVDLHVQWRITHVESGADHRFVLRRDGRVDPSTPLTLVARLPAGAYRVDAWTADGARGEAEFDVGEGLAPVALTLR